MSVISAVAGLAFLFTNCETLEKRGGDTLVPAHEKPFVVVFLSKGEQIKLPITVHLTLNKNYGLRGPELTDQGLQRTLKHKDECVVRLRVDDNVSQDGVYLTMEEFVAGIERLRKLHDPTISTFIYVQYFPRPK